MRAASLFTLMAATVSTLVTAAPPAPGAAVCADLAKAFPATAGNDAVLTSSDGQPYTAAQTGGFNPLNNKLAPACIVQPTSQAQVATVMKSIYRHQANYAVRSGGHTGMAGWDSVQNGVLIDMSKLTDFSFNVKPGTIFVEPGLRWGDIYKRAAEYGVAPMGGRVQHVGTGLVLGGGLSLLSPQYGYACDGLVSAEIVMVDGSTRRVTADTDPQLFRAIKGGGGRFGIVTRYELKAYPTGTNEDKNWYGGSITALTPEGMDLMVQYTEKFVAATDDPKATLLTNVGMLKQNGAPLYLGSGFLFYKGTQDEFNAAFKDFLSIPGIIVQAQPMSYLEATAVTPLGWAPTQAYKWMGGSLYPNSAPTGWQATWDNVKAFLHRNEAVLESAFFSLTPVKTNQIEQGYQNGGNAIAPPRGKSYVHWLFSNILAPGTTAFPQTLESDRMAFLKQNPSSPGLPLFLNEVDASQKTFQSYGWFPQLLQQYYKADPTAFSMRKQQGPTFW